MPKEGGATVTVPYEPCFSRRSDADTTAPGTARARFSRFWRSWEEQLGREFPAPDFTPCSGEFEISARATTVHDAVIADVRSGSLVGTQAVSPPHGDQQVVMHVVRHNAWRFTRPKRGDHTVPAGHFMLQRNGPPTFEEALHTEATVLLLPSSSLSHLIGDRFITGPTSAAEVRLLLGHLNLVRQNAPDLTRTGALAAGNALLELVMGVLRQHPDSTEPQLAPALVQAAKDLADSRLADPDLSPAMLARELGVSVRTLYRAFAAVEETVAGYVRRRRLHRARLELLAPVGRLSVTELAARWQFADSSHFIRAFKSEYGLTPAEFARTPTRPGGNPG
ncbi:AraC family transcriptional activator of tynA and feaB [Streptomyces tendae]|uniref:helix-turn-helix domain-containing protein n=1 Tax=Streptomyces tendae TaxID=1932 RepID=UPI003834B28D